MQGRIDFLNGTESFTINFVKIVLQGCVKLYMPGSRESDSLEEGFFVR